MDRRTTFTLGDSERAGRKICCTREQCWEILLNGFRRFLAHFAFQLSTRGVYRLQLGWIGCAQEILCAKQASICQIVGQLMAAQKLAVIEPIEAFG